MQNLYERRTNMTSNEIINAARRCAVIASYDTAIAENYLRFIEGDKKATSEYIYPNQKEDAAHIVNEFYTNNRRVISVPKKTKVGADGLMIEVAKQMTTHPDDNFIVNSANVRILTGMSNAGWEKDMKEKAPTCFKDKIFHHGQLKRSMLKELRNALIIIDELDTGDKEYQVLHTTLQEAGVLNIHFMEENNIRFLFISATIVKELYELYKWGDLHCTYKMTIPDNYIGHTEFRKKGIIQEFYPLNTVSNVEKWIREDIYENYGDDFRIHIVRARLKTVDIIQPTCSKHGIDCRNHTSSDKIEDEVFQDLFEGPLLTRHIVLIVKGFFRRANLIPNDWKLRIGSTFEYYTKMVDNNVQIQGLPGRMTGYWKNIIESGHKTGPYRTSLKAIEQYEAAYENPFGNSSYQTAGFKKINSKVTTTTSVFVTPSNIVGLVAIDNPFVSLVEEVDIKKNVPIVLPMIISEIDRIHGLPTKQKQKALRDILKEYLNTVNKEILATRIDEFEIGQITRPNTDGSRKRNIDDPVNAFNCNQTCSINVKDKSKNSWQAVFDDKDNRVIFMIYCNP